MKDQEVKDRTRQDHHIHPSSDTKETRNPSYVPQKVSSFTILNFLFYILKL